MRYGFLLSAMSMVVMLTLAPVPGMAGECNLVFGKDTERILDVARGYGSARLTKDSDGDPMIVGRMSGTKYGILFYGCDKAEGCDRIQFVASWTDRGRKFRLQDLNWWNRTKQFGTAFLDEEGDPGILMTVNLAGGVPIGNLDETFDFWRIALKQFKREVLKLSE